ncbi:MAG: DNA gyrase inhibitor YacG [Alphaproteobacteria bacterium]|nr:DNA gyrase inhibitor YacG [Alphaproteobacteria bacterium]
MNQMQATGTCPICKQSSIRQFRPFCSRRCADLDLSRWLKGTYAIPGPELGSSARSESADEEAGGSSDQED